MNIKPGILARVWNGWWSRFRDPGWRVLKVRIATKLTLSFLLIILLTSVIFSIVGVRVIGGRVVAEAQAKVQTDQNAAREICLHRLTRVSDAVRFAADRYLLMNALLAGDHRQAAEAMSRIREHERLDNLTIAGEGCQFLSRAGNAVEAASTTAANFPESTRRL